MRLPLCSLALVLAACTNAGLQPIEPDELERVDDRLAIRGEFCVQPDGEVTFPVKVLFALDQSSSLQLTDTANVRYNALNRVLRTLQGDPDVSIGFIGFSSWTRAVSFTRDRDAYQQFIDPGAGLGPATDYQGALAGAVRMLEEDMRNTAPGERARTRYVVVFISDGVPEPRCNAGCEDTTDDCSDGRDNDGDGIEDGSDPDCANIADPILHPDNRYGICNTTEEIPEGQYVDFDGLCPAYNQPEQVLARVSEIVSLADLYGTGQVTLNSVLLFSEDTALTGMFGYDVTQARAMLRAMAQEGNGVFRDANVTNQDDSFLDFDFATLSTPQALDGLSALNLQARRARDGLASDSDADGLSDAEEQSLELDWRDPDSDADGYTDLVEVRAAARGLDAEDPAVPSRVCVDRTDLDGDRLRDCEESILGLDAREPDTDGDRILDGLELLAGSDPLRVDQFADPDFDGVSTIEEIRAGTLPTIPDGDVYRTERATYAVRDLGLRSIEPWSGGPAQERRCYGFDIEALRLLETPTAVDRGLNRILVYASEQPAQLAGARSQARVACFEAFYRGPQSKDPIDGVIDASYEGWNRTLLGVQAAIDRLASCAWFTGAVDRRAIEAQLDRCMPEAIVLGRFQYERDDQQALLRHYVSSDGAVNVPQPASELFVPIETFDPTRDCVRPWEIDRVTQMLDQIGTACECAVDADFVSPCCGGGR